MRFSALQVNGYGVGLSQDGYPNDVDESMMAATGDVVQLDTDTLDEGSMISNLPLLFANGYPTSLEKITLIELERFVNFMVQCSLGHDTTDVIRKPQWWPKEVKFSNPLARPKKIDDNWTANLKRLVFRCYTYHRSEYLLRFCSYLAKYPHDELEYINNWDSTTSLYHKPTGKLLVTFRNENMNYDKKLEYPHHQRRSLLGGKQPLTMVQPPCEDIYLCDNCDAEFIGLDKMKEHEKTCPEEGGGNQPNSRPGTPDSPILIEPELEQDQFLQYFDLMSKNKEQPSCLPVPSTSATTASGLLKRRVSARVRGSINLTRCPTIPFSSPAGLALSKKSKAMTEDTQQERLERIERHLNAPALHPHEVRPKWFVNQSSRNCNHDQWSVTYKSNHHHRKHVHQYKFRRNSKIKPTLSVRSQLMYMICRPLRVSLKRLTKEELDALKRDPSLYKAPQGNRKSMPGDEHEPITIEDEEETIDENSIESIILVDLCSSSSSSDDEDENTDPKKILNDTTNILLRKKLNDDGSRCPSEDAVFNNNNNNINCTITSLPSVVGLRSSP